MEVALVCFCNILATQSYVCAAQQQDEGICLLVVLHSLSMSNSHKSEKSARERIINIVQLESNIQYLRKDWQEGVPISTGTVCR